MNKKTLKIIALIIIMGIPLLAGVGGYSSSDTATESTSSPSGFFPIGLYCVDDLADFPEIAEAGFNLVQSYRLEGIDTATNDEAGAYLDAAQRAGLRVLMGIPEEVVRENNLDIIRQRVLSFKDHPALYWWQLFDEPEVTHEWKPEMLPLQSLLQAYRAIKRIDSVHPVSIAASGYLDEEYQYAAGTDIVALQYVAIPPGTYEFPYDDPANIGDFYASARATGKPFFAHIYSYNIAKDFLMWPKDVPKSKGRYPTREEIRFLAYASLIHGAQGLLFNCYRFDYGEGHGGDDISRKSNPKQWQAVSSVASELRALESILSTSTLEHTGITVTGGQAAIMLKKYQDRYYLFIANPSSNASEFKVRFDPVRFHNPKITLLPEGQGIAFKSESGTFEVQFSSYEVRIYEIASGEAVGP